MKIEDIIATLEDHAGCRIWNFAMVGKGADIENSNYHEILIYVTRDEKDVLWIKELLADVLNVVEIKFTGVPVAGRTNLD